MRIIVLCLLCFKICFSFAKENKTNALDNDSRIKLIFENYQKALKEHDADFPKKWFITDKEYKDILEYVTKLQPNCVGSDESTFATELNSRVYNDIISSKLIITQIFVKRIEYNYSCGNLLEIPRVVCTIQYGDKKIIEVPFLLVKTTNNEYKILKNFLNYKLFSHE